MVGPIKDAKSLYHYADAGDTIALVEDVFANKACASLIADSEVDTILTFSFLLGIVRFIVLDKYRILTLHANA